MLHNLLSFLPNLWASRQTSGNVVMLHSGRVGSTVVAKMLDHHPRLRWEGEIFEHLSQLNTLPPDRRPDFHLRDALPPLVKLRVRSGDAYRAGCRYGFEAKHHPDQHGHIYGLEVEPFVARLSRLGVQYFIELRRKNYLRQVLSVVRLRQTGQNHVRAGDPVQHSPVVINPDSVPLGRSDLPLRERFAEMDALHKKTVAVLQDRHALHLTYEEDIEDDPACAYRQICDFMGLSPMNPKVSLRRTNDAPLTSLIANYDEIRSELLGTPYEWMLEE